MPNHTDIPPEIWVSIINFTTLASPTPLATLSSLSLISHRFHHLIFCAEHDAAIWRTPAIKLGIHPSLLLDDALFAGNASLEKRSWIRFCKLLKSWREPFSDTHDKLLKLRKAYKTLPEREDALERRTIEITCPGEGYKTWYTTKQTSKEDEGCVVFDVANLKKGTKVDYETVSAVLDPQLGKVRQIFGVAPSPEKGFTQFPYPGSAGYMVEENEGYSEEEDTTYKIRKIDASTASLGFAWNIGTNKPVKFVVKGNKLVVLTSDTRLICFEHWKHTDITNFLWEIDVPVDWADNEEPYTFYPHIKNFHLTAQTVVLLITRHPSEKLGKLTGTYLLILSLSTGKIQRTIKYPKKAPVLHGTQPTTNSSRSPFTSAFAHDFVLTDTFVISGGPFGGLIVWDISQNGTSSGTETDTPLYSIPTPTLPHFPAREFNRPYTSLTISTSGRYLAATMSDCLVLFDLTSTPKRVVGVYGNGRKVVSSDAYVKNPRDEFDAGVWVVWQDWVGASKEKGVMGVGYLTDLADDLVLPQESKPRTRRAMRRVENGWLNNSAAAWILTAVVGLVVSVVCVELGMGRTELSTSLGSFYEALFALFSESK